METHRIIEQIFSNEDYTKAAITAYLLTGESMWSMLETIASDCNEEADCLEEIYHRLRLKISDNV